MNLHIARMNLHIPRRRRAWGLAIAAVALAAGGIVLSTTPEPVNAALVQPPLDPPRASSPRAELHGPSVDGFFAFTEGASLADGLRELYAELRLEGAENGIARRSPVSLAVVLDHSGSMSGDKIVQAREAVVSLLERMHDGDRLAVIVYDHEAQVLQPLASVGELRGTLPARVRRVQAAGGTNIPAGLDLGARVLSVAPSDHVRRLVLVSDGQDGSGEPLPAIAARVAAHASERVTTSSLGIGTDYDERFLSTVADSGRGNYAFLATGAMLDPFLRQELEQASSTVADDVVAELELPAGTILRHAHGALASVDGSHVRLPLGTLFAGERRKVVLELTTPVGNVGTLTNAGVRVRYVHVEDHSAQVIDGGTASVRAVANTGEVEASRDAELHADALATAIDAQQAAATIAWQQGRRDEAVQMTEAHLRTLRRAHAARPSAAYAGRIDELEQDRANFERREASSSEGRHYSLDRGARRRAMAEAY